MIGRSTNSERLYAVIPRDAGKVIPQAILSGSGDAGDALLRTENDMKEGVNVTMRHRRAAPKGAREDIVCPRTQGFRPGLKPVSSRLAAGLSRVNSIDRASLAAATVNMR